MNTIEKFACPECDQIHSTIEDAGMCCLEIPVLYECGKCGSRFACEDDSEDCCVTTEAVVESDPLKRPATPEERAATGLLF